MKKLSALLLIASLVLLAALWLNEKFTFEIPHYQQISIASLLNSFIKTIIVLLAYIAGFFAMIFIALIDIFSTIIWKVEFPIMNFVYDKFFISFSKAWYWDQHSGFYLFVSGLLISVLCLIALGYPDMTRNQRVIYDPAKFNTKAN